MTPRLPTAEQPLPFLASLPPHARGWCWLPVQCVTLTLPTDEARYTAFQVSVLSAKAVSLSLAYRQPPARAVERQHPQPQAH
jgi:hypothetical protein